MFYPSGGYPGFYFWLFAGGVIPTVVDGVWQDASTIAGVAADVTRIDGVSPDSDSVDGVF